MTIEIREIHQNYPLSLLLQADPDIKKIEKYLNKGRCFGAFDETETVGVYVIKDLKDKTAEIMNVSVLSSKQKQGIGRMMIEDAVSRCRTEGFRTLKIATGKNSFQEKFYASCGFEVYETEEGYFTRAYDEPVIDDDGTVLADLVRMELKL